MSYRIEYHTGKKESFTKGSGRVLILLAICLALIFGTASYCGLNGQDIVMQIIFPRGDYVTKTAIQEMIAGLQEGEPLIKAFSELCGTVVDHALE